MQYGTMIDLLQEAERAGEQETEWVRDQLADAFDTWLSDQELEGIRVTGEEQDALHGAFCKGFCRSLPHAA